MRIKIIIMLLCFSLSACSSWLQMGRENFICEGAKEGGECSDPTTIYRNRATLLQKSTVKDVPTPPVEKDTPLRYEYEYVPGDKKKPERVSIDVVSPTQHAVRSADQVQRILIKSFVDSQGNKIDDFWVDTVITPGQWQTSTGGYNGTGISLHRK